MLLAGVIILDAGPVWAQPTLRQPVPAGSDPVLSLPSADPAPVVTPEAAPQLPAPAAKPKSAATKPKKRKKKPTKKPKKKGPTDPLERDSLDVGPAIVDPLRAAAHPSFGFVGEYEGHVDLTGSRRSTVPAALHVNAIGDDGLTGVYLPGRLPGHVGAADNGDQLRGRRFGRQAALTGGRFDVLITNPGPQATARLTDADGVVVGTLAKVQRDSPTLGMAPPPGAVRLFDGNSTEQFAGGRITPEGWLAAGTETAQPWDDFRLHVEFRLPYKPNAVGQHRGNSGVYIQSRYELQVLDSFGFVPAFNDIGSLYRTLRPERIAARPPLQWQTYDIDFRSPQFDSQGERSQPARLQVWLNGVPVHSGTAVPNKTGAGQPEADFPLPTKLQDHKNPVVYRNIWLLPRGVGAAFGPPPTAGTVPPTPVAVPPSL